MNRAGVHEDAERTNSPDIMLVADTVALPVIASGGAGSLEHFY
jgi:imidazole glycerol phosphate synthase subunit HisF